MSYRVTTTSPAGNTEKILNSFSTAKKHYDDFCRFMGSSIETEVAADTILAWSNYNTTRVQFEKLTMLEQARILNQATLFN